MNLLTWASLLDGDFYMFQDSILWFSHSLRISVKQCCLNPFQVSGQEHIVWQEQNGLVDFGDTIKSSIGSINTIIGTEWDTNTNGARISCLERLVRQNWQLKVKNFLISTAYTYRNLRVWESVKVCIGRSRTLPSLRKKLSSSVSK